MAGISFRTLETAQVPDPNRVDIALFLGFVPLREPIAPEATRRRLEVAGWGFRLAANDGALIDVPVRLDSLAEFDALFAATARPDRIARIRSRSLPESIDITEETRDVTVAIDGVEHKLQLDAGALQRDALRERLAEALDGEAAVDIEEVGDDTFLFLERIDRRTAGGITMFANAAIGFPVSASDRTEVLACPLAASARTFFNAGGRTCYVVRLGDPLPLDADETERVQHLGLLLAGDNTAWPAAQSFDGLVGFAPPAPAPASADRQDWHGLGLLHGLEDVSFVLLPDLPELLAATPPTIGEPEPVEGVAEVFIECSEAPAAIANAARRRGSPPRSDAAGLNTWWSTAKWLGQTLRSISLEHMAILALPLADQTIGAGYSDFLAEQIFADDFDDPDTDPQFVQVVFPWVKTASAADLPGGIMPADGLFCGHVARSTLARGTYRTLAGQPLAQVQRLEPADAAGLTPDVGAGRRVTLLERRRGAFRVASDATLSIRVDWQQAAIKRLLAMVYRAARHKGELATFEESSPRLWKDIERSLGALLGQVFRGGGLSGAEEADAFSVTCNRSTMTQADIDAGRVIAQVSLRPAQSVEAIEVALIARGGGSLSPQAGAA